MQKCMPASRSMKEALWYNKRVYSNILPSQKQFYLCYSKKIINHFKTNKLWRTKTTKKKWTVFTANALKPVNAELTFLM